MRSLLISLTLASLVSSSEAGVCQAGGRVRRQAVVKEQVVVQEVAAVPTAVNNIFYSAGGGSQAYAAGYLSRRDDALLAQYDRALDDAFEGMKTLLRERAELLGQQPQTMYGIPFVPIDPRALQQQQNQSYGGYGQQRQAVDQSCPGAPRGSGRNAPTTRGHDPYRPDAPPAPNGAFSLKEEALRARAYADRVTDGSELPKRMRDNARRARAGLPQESMANLKCGQCHSGPDAKKDLDIGNLTDEQRLQAIARARAGEMPPEGEPLNRAELEELTIELFPEFSPEQVNAIFGALDQGGP